MEPKNSFVSNNSRGKHEKYRLCAGAKMFGDALRTINSSRNEKVNKNRSVTVIDGRLENKVEPYLYDNLEITFKVAPETSSSVEVSKSVANSHCDNKNYFDVQSDNTLNSCNNAIKESICITSKHNIYQNNNSFVSDFQIQNVSSEIGPIKLSLSNDETELQASNLNKKCSFNSENASNFSHKVCQVDSKVEHIQETSYPGHSLTEDKNNDAIISTRSYTIFKNAEINNNENSSVFKKNDNFRAKNNSMFRKNSNNISTGYPVPSYNNLSVHPVEDDSISFNDCESSKSDESSTISKRHSLSLNELCAQEPRAKFSKPVPKGMSVNKKRYFVPNSLIDKSYDFLVHCSKCNLPSSSARNVSENSVKENSPVIYPQHLHKNIKKSLVSSNGLKVSNDKDLSINAEYNCRKDVVEKTPKITSLDNSLPYGVVSKESASDSIAVNFGETSDSRSSKRHHIPLSKIFGQPKRFDSDFLDRAMDNSNNNRICKGDNDIAKGVDTEYCNTKAVGYQFNNYENKAVSHSGMKIKYNEPPAYSSSSSTLPSCQNKVKGNDVDHNKENPVAVKKYSTPLSAIIHPKNPSQTSISNAMSENLTLPLKSSALNCSDKNLYNNFTNNTISTQQIPNKYNKVGVPHFDTNYASNKSSVPLNNGDIYHSSSLQYKPLLPNHERTASPLGTFGIKQMKFTVKEDSSSDYSSSECMPLSSESSINNESVNTLDSTDKSNSVDGDSSSSCSDYVPISTDSSLINDSSYAVEPKKLTIPVKKFPGCSLSPTQCQHLSSDDNPCDVQSQYLSSDDTNKSLIEHEGQLYRNSCSTTGSISFQEYMKQNGFVIKCNTDFIFSPKFTRDSSGELPLSRSVLKVMPDVLIGTCLIDSSDESSDSNSSS